VNCFAAAALSFGSNQALLLDRLSQRENSELHGWHCGLHVAVSRSILGGSGIEPYPSVIMMSAPESVPSSARSPLLSSMAHERRVDQSPQLTRLESLWLAERRALEMIAGGTGLVESLQDL
jgi:hypothetical protein